MSGKEFQRELQSAQVECDRLREENNRLRKLLSEHGIPIPAIQTQGPTLVQSVGTAIDAVNHASDSKAKIALFRSLSVSGKMSMRFDGKTPMVGLDTCQRQIAIGRLTMRADPKTARKSTVKHGLFIL
jgi:hypothetical protein